MPGILRAGEPSPEERAANDRHSAAAVAAVSLALLLYAWSFTGLSALIGLPSPRAVGSCLGLGRLPIYDGGGYLHCTLGVDLCASDGSRTERLVYLGGLLVAFLATYFAPVAWKRGTVGLLGLTLAFALFGVRAGSLLTAGLLCVYATFHPKAPSARRAAFAAGALVALALSRPDRKVAASVLIALSGTLAAGAFELASRRLLTHRRAGRAARLAVSQAALLATAAATVREAVTGSVLAIPLGLTLFFWQFERLQLYAIDVEDGAVPEDVPLPVFLSVFVSPPAVVLATRGLNVGQAYSYQAGGFLGTDKNRLVASGLCLWALAFVTLVLGDALLEAIGDVAGAVLGVPVTTLFPSLLQDHLGKRDVPASTVLASTFLSQVRWYLSKAGPIHFMVGAYRVLGYDVAAHYDAPLVATNLVSLWSRFTFHYREFLGRAFYYPVFLGLARKPRAVRVVVATIAAAGAGNLIWGHAVHASVSRGLSGSAFLETLRLWPYFVLLAGGISLTELWLLRRRRPSRQPWSLDRRLPLDVLAAYATFQYFALIEIFFFASRFPDRSLADHAALFLRAFGLGL